MIHELQYSLITHIESNVPDVTGVYWLYTGMTKPGVESLPFVTVEFLIDNIRRLSKDKTTESVFRFQVGVSSLDAGEHARRVDRMKRLLLFTDAVYYDTSGETPVPIGTVSFGIEDITNLGTGELDELTRYNQTYFDVYATITYNK